MSPDFNNCSTIIVKNIWMEDLFEWFHNAINDSSGDGSGVIVCKNYIEASDFFIEWWKNKYIRKEFYHKKDTHDNIINYHDSNENFIFTNKPINLRFHDYNFLIEEDCESMENNYKFGINKIIKSWNKDAIA